MRKKMLFVTDVPRCFGSGYGLQFDLFDNCSCDVCPKKWECEQEERQEEKYIRHHSKRKRE